MRHAPLVFCAVLALAAAAVAREGDEPVPEPLRALESGAQGADAAAARAAFPAGEAGDAIVVAWLRDDGRRARLSARTLGVLAELARDRRLRGANSGLRAILRDESLPREVRSAAVTALAATGTIADVSALGDAVLSFPDCAPWALAAIGGDTARAALRRNEAPGAPLEVGAALVKMGDEEPLARLLSALREPSTAAQAAALLRRATDATLGDDPAEWDAFARRRTLARRFAHPDVDVAQSAVEETVEALKGPAANDVADDVCAILADSNAPVFARAKAALALGLADRRDRKAELLAATPTGQPGDVRRAAVDALARVGDLSCAVPLVRGLVNDEDLDRLAAKRVVRQEFTPVDPAVVRALYRWGVVGGVGGGGGWGTLIELFAGDYRTGLHRDALRAFREVSGDQFFGYEPDAAKADRMAAVAKMRAWWREARETIPLAPRPDDPGRAAFDRDVEQVVKSMAELKTLYAWRARMTLTILAEPAHERLVAALADADLHIRMGAAQVLEDAGLRQSAIPLARRLAAETNSAMRMRLISALEVCGRPGAIPRGSDGKPIERWTERVREAVLAALADKNLDVRIAAARALGVVGSAGADAKALLAARAEPRNAIDAFRAPSAASLLRFGDRSAIPDLVAELRSDDVARRAEGLRLLRAASLDVPGYDPDAKPEAREAAVRAFEAAAGVPKGGRK